MLTNRSWFNNSWLRVLQHVLFWALSFYIFLHLFKVGSRPERIDYIYTTLFHLFILPPVYINLEYLLPWLRKTKYWTWYFILIIIVIALFSWINFSFFSTWSNSVLPDYFFISYFSFLQVANFFVVYISLTSLLKLSKSWFIVTEIQTQLLKVEKEKSIHEKELLEMEARALRAQMNPHFIFNCMNSIKSLMQLKEEDRAINYLTTFSKLMRTLFQNSDKRQISLYDEIETCRLYVQLEAMRLNGKLNYLFDIDPNLDLKSVMVPALIIQPFIENAIWHGIVPRGEGNVTITIKGNNDTIICKVNDDGIGRERSKLNKSASPILHESKGVFLSQARLNLGKLLNDMDATIETIDKHENGKACGTIVTFTFKLN
jgi:sensor histidine kinase YesM